MTGADWPDKFEKLLRSYLPLLEDDTPLNPEVALPDLGLDSISTVGLLVDVEESFDVRLPDEALTQETFSTPTALWAVVTKLCDKN